MPLRNFAASLSALGRRYYLLFTAGLLSDIGGFSTHTALLLHVYKLTDHNIAYMGISTIFAMLPMVVSAPFGGVLAERFNRKWIMIANDLLRLGVVLLMIPAAGSVWLLFILQGVVSASTALFMPSRQAIIPELVQHDQVHMANSLNSGVLSLVHILGPVIGAYVYARTQSLMWIVMFDAGTYLASAGLLCALVYLPSVNLKNVKLDILDDINQGIRYIWSKADFFHIFVVLLSANTAVGILVPLLRPFIGEVLNGTDENYGHLIAAFGIGGIFGPFVGYWSGRRFGLGKTMTAAFMSEGAMMIAWPHVTNFYASCAMLVLWGVIVFTMFPCYMSYIHSFAREDMMGRTFSLFDQTVYMANIIGATVVALAGNVFDTQTLLTLAGGGHLTIVLLRFRTVGARLMRSRHGEVRSLSEMHGGEAATDTKPDPPPLPLT